MWRGSKTASSRYSWTAADTTDITENAIADVASPLRHEAKDAGEAGEVIDVEVRLVRLRAASIAAMNSLDQLLDGHNGIGALAAADVGMVALAAFIVC